MTTVPTIPTNNEEDNSVIVVLDWAEAKARAKLLRDQGIGRTKRKEREEADRKRRNAAAIRNYNLKKGK